MNKSTIQPKISLVGAGPGDPDLITVKGLKALRSANVVLYDALIAEELLEEIPPQTLKVYVGKRANNHRFSQPEINMMMVQMAYQYGHVVRLKGGDPFVFGRGHEELQFATSFDIETQVIPGISSCIAVAENQGVPLTRRGVNQSFWVVTGTTSKGELSKDLCLAAQSSATVVVLMGMRKLSQIVELFQKEGKGETPVMIVQNGTKTNERFVLGTIDTIVELASEEKMGTPAIIVIGNVVDLHPELNYEQATYLTKAQMDQLRNGK